MGIPHTGLPREGFNIIYVRTDWLQKLGLSEPKTMDDLLKISRAFTKQDPDGNGKDDTVGLVVDKDLWQWIMGFMNGYHAYPNAWIKDKSGKQLVYGSVQPEVKTALAKLAELYKDGQIDKEFAVKDYAKASELLTGGKAGLFYGFFWSPLYPLQPGREKDPNYDWRAFPPVSVDSQPATAQVDLGVYGYWVVRKGYKNPEAVVRMLNLWMKYFYQNTEDAIYKKYVNWDDGNEVWQNAWPQAYRAFKNVAGYINDNQVLTGKKQLSEVTPEERGELEKIQKFQKQGDQTNWCWDRIYGIDGALRAVQSVRDKDYYLMNEFYGAPTATMVDRSSTLADKQAEIFTKIIMGTLPIDAFDGFVNDWKNLGGQQITKEVNDWFAKKSQ
jgi:putative aldouronate transport system substrate-binding protein